MPKGVTGAQDRRQTVVSDRVLFATMGTLAALIEEPYCILGAEELRGVVLAFNALDRALGSEKLEYVFRDGCAVIRSSGEVLKSGINKSVLAESTAGELKNA
jgi:hypothetical protein